jgi:hypothetical protein
MSDPRTEREERLREELHDREVEGVAEMPRDEQDAVVETAEANPDPTTQRESIEQELMELHESDKGAELGD